MGVRSASASSTFCKGMFGAKIRSPALIALGIQEDSVLILYKDHILLLNDVAL
jgi:hypothetical protein